MIKLVVFDWNGTLIADTLACCEANNYILKHYGGKKVSLKVYKETNIIPAIDFYVDHGCDRLYLIQESKKIGEVFHKYYEDRALKIRTRKNAHKLLKWLFDHKIESLILSNHTVSGIEKHFDRLKIKKYISGIIANQDLDASIIGRNKGEKLKIYLKKRKLKKEEVMIIGDSPEEVEIGKQIGIKTVAITNGYYSTNRLVKSKPDYLISNLEALIKIIRK